MCDLLCCWCGVVGCYCGLVGVLVGVVQLGVDDEQVGEYWQYGEYDEQCDGEVLQQYDQGLCDVEFEVGQVGVDCIGVMVQQQGYGDDVDFEDQVGEYCIYVQIGGDEVQVGWIEQFEQGVGEVGYVVEVDCEYDEGGVVLEYFQDEQYGVEDGDLGEVVYLGGQCI